jgi:hypothetical protein
MLTNGVGVTKTTRPKLVFNRYGDQYGDSGRELPGTKSKRQEAKSINPQVETIVATK